MYANDARGRHYYVVTFWSHLSWSFRYGMARCRGCNRWPSSVNQQRGATVRALHWPKFQHMAAEPACRHDPRTEHRRC